MQINFYKYQGTGNDFVLIDNRRRDVVLNTEQIRLLCDRRFGIGADGLMLLEAEPGVDFKMVYYNSDGRESSMCGNGGRCIVAFAHHLGVIGNSARFMAVDGIHEATLGGGLVALKMQDVKEIESGDNYFCLNTGSPHYVTFVTGLQSFDVVGEGRKLRYNESFAPEGTNVNFVEKLEQGLFVRTYERGVEDETFSCGTGVTAVALVAALTGSADTRNSCHLLTRGGALDVSFEKVLETNFYNIWLKGPAMQVFQGSVKLENDILG